MLIAMPFLISRSVKAAPVNCEPWSMLKISTAAASLDHLIGASE
jgi:hypothetical protein